MDELAIDGGAPVRSEPLPIFRLALSDAEKAAVARVLEGGHISRGQARDDFGRAFCSYTGAEHALVCSSGTTALHLAVAALGLEAGSEVIVPSLSFVATAFAAEYSDLVPVFAEVDPETLCLDTADVEARITERTAAVITVHFAGQVADLSGLREVCARHDIALIEDAAHAAGARARHGDGRLRSSRHPPRRLFQFLRY